MQKAMPIGVALAALVAWLTLPQPAPAQQDGAAGDAATQPTTQSADYAKHVQARMEVTQGDESLGTIVLQLNAAKAPISTLNFIKYAQDDFYQGTIFHRVVPDFMIQGGGFTPQMDEKSGLRDPIYNEWDNGLKHERGTIAMARTPAPHSATAQFFINVVDTRLNERQQPGYAVFGKVVEGMDVVDKIRYTTTEQHPKLPMGKVVPATPVVIKDVKVQEGFDVAALEQHVAELRKEREAEQEARQAKLQADFEKWVDEKKEELEPEARELNDGIVVFEQASGDGASPTAGDTVRAHLSATLQTGQPVVPARPGATPVGFPVSQFGPAMSEVFQAMQVGDKWTILAPPSVFPQASLPSGVMFEVELVDVIKQSSAQPGGMGGR